MSGITRGGNYIVQSTMTDEAAGVQPSRLNEAMAFIGQDIAELHQRYEAATTDEDRVAINHDREVYQYILCVLRSRAIGHS